LELQCVKLYNDCGSKIRKEREEDIYLIDIHTHLIPNVDDGADSIDETLRLAEAAVAEGISHAILTPHHNRYWVINEKDDVIERTKKVEQAIQKANIPLTVSPSQEIRMNEEFSEDLFAGNYLSLDGEGKYYLVEFSWDTFPSFAYDYLKEMIDANITPVIAHPERQYPFIENPNLLKSLIQMGCISQITATSIVGGYTEEIRQAAFDMMDEGLIHVIASDAHDTVMRPFNLVGALEVVEADYGADYKDYIINNAKRIFSGKAINLKQF
jgi:protein-tyrosine phosphatase